MINTPEEITPQLLTSLLCQAGVLASGEVSRVDFQDAGPLPFGKPHQVFHLALTYNLTEPEHPPTQIFLKFGSSRKEYFFYTRMAPLINAGCLPRCYYTGYDPSSDRTCLLLEDLSATYQQSEWPLPPNLRQCQETIACLAEIHADWWERPLLESELRPALPPGRSWADRTALACEKLPEFLAFLGDRLSPRRRAIYQALLKGSRPWSLPAGAPRQTLLHGDMHFWNVLYPLSPEGGLPRIFDWNMWDVGRPSDDLAYLLALHWYPERRARYERGLLKEYLDQLRDCGVQGYTWNQLWHDYRVSVMRSLLIPVWQWVRGIQPGVWWPHLERGMLAFEDLSCRELLEGENI